jgi:hypothetical protein
LRQLRGCVNLRVRDPDRVTSFSFQRTVRDLGTGNADELFQAQGITGNFFDVYAAKLERGEVALVEVDCSDVAATGEAYGELRWQESGGPSGS